MNDRTNSVVFVGLLVAIVVLLRIDAASARGGGAANIMGSPGYQRALEESRKRYQQSATQPRVQPSAVHKRKKPQSQR